MSRAVASAKQRRAGVSAPEPPALAAAAPPANGLTLPQVIALVDTRLIKLEKFMKDTLDGTVQSVPSVPSVPIERSVDPSSEETSVSQILEEYDNRFILLAEEIGQIKDTLMKLQTYTMDVNKMLLEERVNVLSDLGDDKTMFVMEDATLAGGDVERVEK